MTTDNSKEFQPAANKGAKSKSSSTSTGKRSSARYTGERNRRGDTGSGAIQEAMQPGVSTLTAEEQPAKTGITSGRPGGVQSTTREDDMLRLLQDVALAKVTATPLQVRAAIAAVQYTHAKMGEGGKKAAKAAAAKKAAGKFASLPPPKLVVNNGK